MTLEQLGDLLGKVLAAQSETPEELLDKAKELERMIDRLDRQAAIDQSGQDVGSAGYDVMPDLAKLLLRQ